MNYDGYITANELGLFLNEKVTIDSENQQTPQYGRMTSQEGEFVFIYSENTIIKQDNQSDSNEEKMDLILDELAKLKSNTAKVDNNSNEEKEPETSKKTIYIQLGLMVLIISVVMIMMIKR